MANDPAEPWWQQLQALAEKERTSGQASSHWVQMATCNRELSPRVRTVVIRDTVLHGPGRPLYLICTDIRSQKIQESDTLTQSAELCWLLPKQWTQFRLQGHVHCYPDPQHPLGLQHNTRTSGMFDGVTAEQHRRRIFAKLQPNMQWTFRQASIPPGLPLHHAAALSDGTTETRDLANDMYNFALLVFEPVQVEKLLLIRDGGADKQQWTLCETDQQWTHAHLSP